MDIEGLVESSLNLGVVETGEESIEIISSIRSSVGTIKDNIFHTVATIAELTNGKVTAESDYPEWKYNPDSKVRLLFIELYEKLFGEKPLISAIHAVFVHINSGSLTVSVRKINLVGGGAVKSSVRDFF